MDKSITNKDLKEEIANKVDYIIKAENECELSGKPSSLIINGKPLNRN